MYQIKQNGSVIGYSDDVIFVRLHENGCYVPCERAQAGGFCVKVPVDYTEENGETKTRLEDFVYKFSDDDLLGIEPTATVEQFSGALMIAEADKVVDILVGGATLTGGGALVKSGTRINWKGALKRATVDLWDTAENTPEAAPNLWEDVLYKNGVRVIPSPITAGLAFSKGERGYWGDVLYESLLDSNTWTPEEYPAGWQEVTA